MSNRSKTNPPPVKDKDKKESFGQKISHWFSKKKNKKVSDKMLDNTEEYLASFLEQVPRKVLSPQEAIKIKRYDRLNTQNHLNKYLLPAENSETTNETVGKILEVSKMEGMVDKDTANVRKKLRKSDDIITKKSSNNLRELAQISITKQPSKNNIESKPQEKDIDNKQTTIENNTTTTTTTETSNQTQIIDPNRQSSTTVEDSNTSLELSLDTNLQKYQVKEKKDLLKYFKVAKQLAKTNFSTVFLANVLETNASVAIKEIHLSTLPTKELEQLCQEKNLLLMLKHPNIIDLMSVYEIPDYNFLVFEYCRGGDLFDRISTEGGFIELRGKKIMKALTETIAFLHKNRVCHRDLKPENVLLTNKKKLDIKLCDFGIACKIPNDGKMNVLCGSRGYFAPEVMLKKPYDEKVDMFSLGVVCFAVLAGYQPFYGETDREMIKANLDVDYDFDNEAWEYVSEEAKDFINQLLQKNPLDRLSSEDALNHPWFQKKESRLI